MTTFLNLTEGQFAHVDQRLRTGTIAWLISSRADGRPHAAPIGFFWDGEFVWIFTRPNSQKIRNIHNDARVLLILDETHGGVDPISIEGTATLLASADLAPTLAPYAEKYSARFKVLGLSTESLAAQYSQAIRIAPTRIVDVIPAASRVH